MELYVRSESVVSRVIAGETLIVPISKGVGDLASIYSLNPVATTIWETISRPRSKREIVQVIAREFEGKPRVLVIASPTRGLDVAAIETVHRYLRDAASSGVGVLLISEDLDEILALADRIAVIYEGAIVGELDATSATVEEIGLLMAGGERE
jgi:ABC-type Na+ transport system ATPase subunit NatA